MVCQSASGTLLCAGAHGGQSRVLLERGAVNLSRKINNCGIATKHQSEEWNSEWHLGKPLRPGGL